MSASKTNVDGKASSSGEATRLIGSVRNLQAGDLDELFHLHTRVIQALPPTHRGFIDAHPREYFEEDLGGAGLVVGFFEGPKLIGYGSIRKATLDGKNFGKLISMPISELSKVCHCNGAGVLPSCRGMGVHAALTRARIQAAKDRRWSNIFVEIHVDNIPALVNSVKCDFDVVATTQNAVDRHLILKGRTAPPPTLKHILHRVPVANFEGHKLALSSGLMGRWLLREAGSLNLCYTER